MHGVLYNLGYVTSLHVELGSKYMYFTEFHCEDIPFNAYIKYSWKVQIYVKKSPWHIKCYFIRKWQGQILVSLISQYALW